MTCEDLFRKSTIGSLLIARRLGRRDGIYQVYDMVSAIGHRTGSLGETEAPALESD